MLSRKIMVRRSIFSAAERLRELSLDCDMPPVDLAEQKIDDCRAAGDAAGIGFWRRVWFHLMQIKYEPKEITVIEDASGPREFY